MMRLAARFGDGWNAWSPDPQTLDSFRPLTEELARACEEVGRDPASIGRSIDVAVDPHRLLGEERDVDHRVPRRRVVPSDRRPAPRLR